MTTITQLEYILAVNKEQHFGKAAKTCFVSQPSLSAQVHKLEDELGVIIFDRSRKPIQTTEPGKEIIEQAKIIIHEHTRLRTIADVQSIEPKGKFELAIIPTLASSVIPLFIGDFSKKYPNVNLGISEYKTEDIIRLIAADEIDAGLLVTPLDDNRLIEKPLFYEPFYCYLNKDHPLSQKRFISGADLDSDDLWLLTEGHCFREQVIKVCSKQGDSGVLPNIRFESGNLDTLIKLVKTNSGFTLLPQLAVDELSEVEKAEHIKAFRNPVPTREVSLVHNKGFLKETIIKALQESILLNLPGKIKSLKNRNIDVVNIS